MPFFHGDQWSPGCLMWPYLACKTWRNYIHETGLFHFLCIMWTLAFQLLVRTYAKRSKTTTTTTTTTTRKKTWPVFPQITACQLRIRHGELPIALSPLISTPGRHPAAVCMYLIQPLKIGLITGLKTLGENATQVKKHLLVPNVPTSDASAETSQTRQMTIFQRRLQDGVTA